MFLYRLERPTDIAKQLADTIKQEATEVVKAVSTLSGHINQTETRSDDALRSTAWRHLGDDPYRKALADLFAGSTDVVYIVKWREIYEDMESAIDGGEVAADVMESIALKYS